MKPKLLSIIKTLALLAIAFLLLYFAFRGVSLKRIFSEMMKAKLIWIFFSFLVSLIALVSRAYRWNLLIEPLGYKPKLKNTTYAVSIGYFANLAFPRLGEVTRCGSLSKAEDIPFGGLLGTVVVERAVDVLSLLICILLTAIIEFNRLGNFLMENIFNPILKKFQQYAASPYFIVGILIVIGGVVFLILILRKRRKKAGSENKIISFLQGIMSGLKSIANLKSPWLFIFHSIFIWFLYYISVYLCFFSLPATTGLGLGAALFLLVAGGLGMSAPVQGGIGAYHILVSQGLILYGLTKEDGLTFATLIHAIQTVLILLLGSISLILLLAERKRNAKQNDNSKKVEVEKVHS